MVKESNSKNDEDNIQHTRNRKKTREADQKERNRKNFLQRPKKGVSKEPKMMEGDIENGNGG